jgi:hypothetical protein
MVEDEFLSTAQLFTASIHREEYLRQKKVAAQERKTGVQSSHTDEGRTKQSGLTKVKIAAADLRKKRKKALINVFGTSGAGDVEDEDQDGYNLDPKLSALMAPKTQERKLIKSTISPKSSRSRFGVSRSMSMGEILSPEPNIPELESSPISRFGAQLEGGPHRARSIVEFPLVPPLSTSESRHIIETTDSPSDLSLPASKPKNPRIQQLLAKRKAQKAAEAVNIEEDDGKGAILNVPTFLL